MNRKRYTAFLIILFTICTTVYLHANISINNAHRGMTANGKAVNCAYCHSNPSFKIEQIKGQLQGESVNGIPFSKISTCAGSGCH